MSFGWPIPPLGDLPDVCTLFDGLLNHLRREVGSADQAVVTLRKHLPNWNGKTDTSDDIRNLFDEIDKYFHATTVDGKKGSLPEDGVKALMALYLGDMGDVMSAKMHEHFEGLDVFKSFMKLWTIFAKSVEAKRKGGQATKKWTPEVEALAREIFAEQKRARLRDTPAYQRTANKLNTEHGYEFSPSTVRRHLHNSNAKR